MGIRGLALSLLLLAALLGTEADNFASDIYRKAAVGAAAFRHCPSPEDYPFISCDEAQAWAKLAEEDCWCLQDEDKPCWSCDGFPAWAIAVIVVGAVLVLAIPLAIILCCCCGLLCFAKAIA